MRAASIPSIRHVARCGALVALTLVCVPRAATGQAATIDAAAVRTTYLSELEELQSKFLQLAEAIPADKYSWRPGPGVARPRSATASARPARSS